VSAVTPRKDLLVEEVAGVVDVTATIRRPPATATTDPLLRVITMSATTDRPVIIAAAAITDHLRGEEDRLLPAGNPAVEAAVRARTNATMDPRA
jgi:hypothetical protein